MFHISDWTLKQATTSNDYTGIIVNIQDPNKNNRAQVRIPYLHSGVPDEYLPWFRNGNISNNVKGSSEIRLPVIGSTVKVKFENGNFYNGIFYEGLKSTTDLDEEFLQDYGTFNGTKDQWGNSIKTYSNKNVTFSTNSFNVNATDSMFNGNLGASTGISGSFPLPSGQVLIFQNGILIGG